MNRNGDSRQEQSSFAILFLEEQNFRPKVICMPEVLISFELFVIQR